MPDLCGPAGSVLLRHSRAGGGAGPIPATEFSTAGSQEAAKTCGVTGDLLASASDGVLGASPAPAGGPPGKQACQGQQIRRGVQIEQVMWISGTKRASAGGRTGTQVPAGFCCCRREEGQLGDECGRLPRVLRLDRMRCGKPQDEGQCLEPLGVKESLLERECPILLPGFEPFRAVFPRGSDAES